MKTYICADIIVCLILGIVFLCAFIFWQHLLERHSSTIPPSPSTPSPSLPDSVLASSLQPLVEAMRAPPPLMKLSLWHRANGRFAAAMGIALTTWCSFLGSIFWTQVRERFLGVEYHRSLFDAW